MCSLGIEPTTFCAADAMLYHWATQELPILPTCLVYLPSVAHPVYTSDDEVKRFWASEALTQLYREKVYYSTLFKTVHAVAILWS